MIHQVKQIVKKAQRGAVVAEFVPIPALIIGAIALTIILITNS